MNVHPRLRRLRSSEALRRLTADVRLRTEQLVLPVFAQEGIGAEEPIDALPGQFRWPVDQIDSIAKKASSLGIQAVIVFGVPATKDERGSRAWAPDGPTQRAIATIRAAVPELAVFADTCLCSFTTDGHCGVTRDGAVDNDASVEILAQVAVSQAEAGAAFVAPSDMMDGRVGAIRRALDEAGHESAGIMAYSAKYASAMYGPFRAAADCTPAFGDRRSYQIDPASRQQGMQSIERDIAEGADIVMVKPALPYLDVIAEARSRFDVPIAAYSVSGEYSMIKAAAERGWLDEQRAVLESLTAITRAGASMIVTYSALDAAGWLEATRG